MRQALGRAAGHILEIGIVLHHPGHDLEKRDAAGEGVGRGLENIQRRLVVFGDLTGGLNAVHGSGEGLALDRGGQVFDN